MFGTKVDNEITMLQRVVALFRDLILGVVLLITCVIVYFGGDSSKLNALDWTKLVGAASLIVVGPVVLFLGFKLYARVMRFLLHPYFYVCTASRSRSSSMHGSLFVYVT